MSAEQYREAYSSGGTRQSRDGHALMGPPHESAPDLHRQSATRHMFGRRTVVVTEPDSGYEMRRIANEPGVAKILRCSSFSGGGPARQHRLMRGADGERLRHHLVHHCHVPGLDDAAELSGVARVKHLTVRSGNLLDDVWNQCVAAVGECRVSADELQHRDF